MPVSAQQRLLRTLIAALKAVAAKYNVVLDGFQERTATDAAVRRAYKKVVRKAHPDPNTSDPTQEIDMTTGLHLNHKISSKFDPQLASQGIHVP